MNKAWIRIATLGTVVALAMLGSASLGTSANGEELESGLLDGMTFGGTTGEVGGEEEYEDGFVFVDGTFRSTACDEYGFEATPYTAEMEDDVIVFHAVAKSESEGTMTWNGRVDEGEIEGTAVWEKSDQDPIEYWFHGTVAE